MEILKTLTTKAPNDDSVEYEADYWTERFEEVRQEISQKVIGHDALVELLLVTIISEGHILLEGQPGLGKSLVINSLAQNFGAKVKHVHQAGNFTGTNFLIIDEFVRSDEAFRRSLLTAMQEKECIVREELLYLERPFTVMATINPTAYRLGEPLTAAELDRFMFCYEMPLLSREYELGILDIYQTISETKGNIIFSVKDILTMQRLAANVILPPKLKGMIVDIIIATRQGPSKDLPLAENFRGLSPRCSIYVATASRARAFLYGRTMVEKEDVLAVIPPIFGHRLQLHEGADKAHVIEAIIASVEC